MSLRASRGLYCERSSTVATLIEGMTMSLDGFVADAHGSVGRLYPDLDALRVLGAGLRLLQNVEPEQAQLEKIDVHEIGARTSLRFRIVKGESNDGRQQARD
jgi:hypothetical protein